MKTRLSYCLLLIILVVQCFISSKSSYLIVVAQKSNDAARAQLILSKAREVVFRGVKPEDVKAMSLTWDIRFHRPDGDLDTGELVYDLRLPNSFLHKQTRNIAGNRGQFTLYNILNDQQVLSDMSVSGGIPIMRTGGRQSDPTDEEKSQRLQSIRKDMSLQLLQLMLPHSPDFPLAFEYVGEARASDGQAEVIGVSGPNNFSARLFIDKSSFRLLLMTYEDQRAIKFKSIMRENKSSTPKPVSQSEIEGKVRFSNYSMESGVLIPHLVTYERGGKILEEQSLKKFRLNPVFDSDHFQLSKKRK